MTKCIDAEGEPEAKEWLRQACKHGIIPVHNRLQETGVITPGELGSMVELKCGSATATVQLIEDTGTTAEQFWSLPEELTNKLEDDRSKLQALSVRHRQHAAIGYARVLVRRRPTY